MRHELRRVKDWGHSAPQDLMYDRGKHTEAARGESETSHGVRMVWLPFLLDPYSNLLPGINFVVFEPAATIAVLTVAESVH